MNTLFPLITEYNEEFKEYYTYRQIYLKWNINSEAYRLHKQYTDFPDPSYYWVYPKGEEPKERHVLFGTYYIQHEIWKHQFPATCEDKKFLIVPLWYAGIGSTLHILTIGLAWALQSNRILIPFIIERRWGDPDFCDPDNQSILCYLNIMTNCTIPNYNYIQLLKQKNQDIPSIDLQVSNSNDITAFSLRKYLLRSEYLTYNILPVAIDPFLGRESSLAIKKWYWRVQGVTFITRLNERTVNWIQKYEKENCKECKNEYDISLHIRHGDKGSEMKLIDADVYKEAIKILTSLGMKKNYTVYVNADDQESVDIIHTLPYDVASFNQSRSNYGYNENIKKKLSGLESFANLYNQIRADHCVGTIGSNWNRLIYALKDTVGMKSDGYLLDIGFDRCLSFSHCKINNKLFFAYF